MSLYFRRGCLLLLLPLLVIAVLVISFMSRLFGDRMPIREGFEELFFKPWKGGKW